MDNDRRESVDVFRGFGVEVKLDKPGDFLKVKETLTRIGIAPSLKEKKLYQSCHILHKQGRYAIIHFKELYALDGREFTFSEEDRARRNTITDLLDEWGLIIIIDPSMVELQVPINQIRILNFKEKSEWTLEPKYRFWEKRS